MNNVHVDIVNIFAKYVCLFICWLLHTIFIVLCHCCGYNLEAYSGAGLNDGLFQKIVTLPSVLSAVCIEQN